MDLDNLETIDTTEADEPSLKRLIAEGEEKADRVRVFLKNNASHGVWSIVEKFNLSHNVTKDLGNGLVRVGFFADESYRVICFGLYMDYNELLDRQKKGFEWT